ncbi:unnamed protein product [Bursaphelenchus okinawaensis]|uniref:ANK_REP_REGION domain-containing protein n=1 Tax=Bursaphelenchus okinawaensis TaxID=465554 RepID=A0A811JT62_9BILA|nr:unnamed protein product [Bursaphelenchus okinawaensis]CAG9082137.1 unnamed protein product [Bursaphelenchus okinawaensis]
MIPIPPKPGKVNAYYVLRSIDVNNCNIAEGETVFVEECKPTPDLCQVSGSHGVCEVSLDLVKSEAFELIQNPIHEAAKRGNLQLLESCLNNKMSPNLLDRSGSVPLYWASYNGHINVVIRLLQCENIDVQAQNKMGDNSLHAAARRGHLDICETLVGAGADVNVPNNDKNRALEMAANPEIASFIRLTMEKNPPTEQIDEYQSSDED